MSALTSIFNFLYVYLRFVIGYVTGSKIYLSSFNEEQLSIARNILDSLGFTNIVNVFSFNGEPILMLIVGVFAVGSIIGLVRRLMR